MGKDTQHAFKPPACPKGPPRAHSRGCCRCFSPSFLFLSVSLCLLFLPPSLPEPASSPPVRLPPCLCVSSYFLPVFAPLLLTLPSVFHIPSTLPAFSSSFSPVCLRFCFSSLFTPSLHLLAHLLFSPSLAFFNTLSLYLTSLSGHQRGAGER